MPKVDPRRHRSAIINFRTTPMVARYVKATAAALGENVSDYVREAIRVRIEIERTYKDVADQMGYKSVTTLVWHAVQEYALRHAPDRVVMPPMPEEDADEPAAV